MKSALFAAVGLAALLAANAASAVVIADFQLNNSLANGVAGPVTLTNNGATLGATGLTFAANAGPTLTNLGVHTEYSLEIGGTLDGLGGFRKIADFFDRASDTGFYALGNGLNFYPVVTGPNSLASGTPFVVKLTRESSGLLTGYVNGVSQWSFNDTSNLAVISNTLHLFRDDFATGQSEASSGFIDFVTLDTAVGAPGGGVPEPASWALMILGFGSAGAMLRRRREALAA